MCVVSMIGDHYNDKFDPYKKYVPQQQPGLNPFQPNITTTTGAYNFSLVTKEEFDALKKEVEEMKVLLKRAVEYDKRNNEPNCEMEDKVKLLKQIASLVGVDLKDVFQDKK